MSDLEVATYDLSLDMSVVRVGVQTRSRLRPLRDGPGGDHSLGKFDVSPINWAATNGTLNCSTDSMIAGRPEPVADAMVAICGEAWGRMSQDSRSHADSKDACLPVSDTPVGDVETRS